MYIPWFNLVPFGRIKVDATISSFVGWNSGPLQTSRPPPIFFKKTSSPRGWNRASYISLKCTGFRRKCTVAECTTASRYCTSWRAGWSSGMGNILFSGKYLHKSAGHFIQRYTVVYGCAILTRTNSSTFWTTLVRLSCCEPTRNLPESDPYL